MYNVDHDTEEELDSSSIPEPKLHQTTTSSPIVPSQSEDSQDIVFEDNYASDEEKKPEDEKKDLLGSMFDDCTFGPVPNASWPSGYPYVTSLSCCARSFSR